MWMFFFFSSRRRHTRYWRDWSSDVCSSDLRIGSDTMLVAPVTVGDGAYTAAGSVITTHVPPGAMAVARARQRDVAGWVSRRRPGTPAAEAAERAEEAARQDGEQKEGATSR